MAETIPPEIIAHQNRISPELREFLIQTLEGSFSGESAKQIGRILWNLVDDPVYENDDELKYLASKIGVIVGQYDLAIKCISESIPGTRVWGSVALFEIGEVDQAFSHLDHIIENENSDLVPLVEALFWIIYLKLSIGNTENIDNYKGMIIAIFDERQSRLIPGQLQQIKDFAEGLVEQQSANNVEGLKKIEEFIENRKEAKDQFWQLMALLTIGEQKLDSSDFISSEKIYTRTKELAENLSNVPLMGASDIGLAYAYYLKGELKKGNMLSAQTIEKLQGISQYYLIKGNFIRGQILKKLGHHKLARESLNTSYAFANQYHDYNRSFLSLLALADSYIITNEKEEAQQVYDKAYNHVVNIANKRQFTRALVQIAIGDYRQGNIENALKRVDQIETLSEEIQYQRGKTDSLRLRAQIAISRNDDIKRQILILKACQILYFEVGDAESQANCDVLIAEAYTKLGDNDKAENHLDEAKVFYLAISDSMKIAEIKELQASFDIQEGRYDEALVKLRSSYSHYSDVFDRNKRVRCLRKIADILALKGDFQESVIRYKKVQDITIEANNLVENVIINLNRARINLYLENYDEIIDDYKYAERFLFENGLENILVDILAEKGLLYIFSDKEELFEEVLEKLGENEREGIATARVWISFLNGIKQIHKGEYNDAYGTLISTLQEALEVDKLISVGVLFNLIRIIVEIYKENLDQPFVSEEVNNYLGLISGIVNESNFFYLKGLSYLVNLLWQIITKKGEDHNEIIVQASEYFAKTGIEEFGNFLLILQYNMAEWFGLEGVKIQSVFATPRKFETPQIALIELLEKAGRAIILENLLSTESEILETL